LTTATFQQLPWLASDTWADGSIAGWDLETTSVETDEARIVSAALVLDVPAEDKRWVKTWLVNPGIEIPLAATAVHGITTEAVQRDGIPAATAITEMQTAFAMIRQEYGAIPLAIFNAAYDLTVLDRELARHLDGSIGDVGLPIIDPLVCDRKLDKYRKGKRTLAAISAAYGIAIKGAHTADGDVLCTIKLARAIGSKYPFLRAHKPANLQAWQANAQQEWAKHYQEYRREHGDAECVIPGDWPYRERSER
jgi:DNA polymerase-3 subunit epsilon